MGRAGRVALRKLCDFVARVGGGGECILVPVGRCNGGCRFDYRFHLKVKPVEGEADVCATGGESAAVAWFRQSFTALPTDEIYELELLPTYEAAVALWDHHVFRHRLDKQQLGGVGPSESFLRTLARVSCT